MFSDFFGAFLDIVGQGAAAPGTGAAAGARSLSPTVRLPGSNYTSRSPLFTRLGNVVLMQAFLYLPVRDACNARLVSHRMCREVRDYAVAVVKYLKKSGAGRVDLALNASLAASATAPLQMLHHMLRKQVLVAHANGNLLVDVSAIESGEYAALRGVRRLPVASGWPHAPRCCRVGGLCVCERRAAAD